MLMLTSKLLDKIFRESKAKHARLLRELNEGERLCGRRMTHDVAILGRMGAGFPGAVNRTHPATIEPCLIDSTHPPLNYGVAVLADAASPNGVRSLLTTDTAITAIYGITVRPYPLQPQTATNFGTVAMGAGTPPSTGWIDILRAGYIIVGPVYGATAPTKGGAVYVDVNASSGTTHLLGGFQATSGSGLIALDATGARISWNGGLDANLYGELVFQP